MLFDLFLANLCISTIPALQGWGWHGVGQRWNAQNKVASLDKQFLSRLWLKWKLAKSVKISRSNIVFDFVYFLCFFLRLIQLLIFHIFPLLYKPPKCNTKLKTVLNWNIFVKNPNRFKSGSFVSFPSILLVFQVRFLGLIIAYEWDSLTPKDLKFKERQKAWIVFDLKATKFSPSSFVFC